MATADSTHPEQWRDIPGYRGYYEVSDAGRVRSLPRIVPMKNSRGRRYSGKVLKPFDGGGYTHPHVILSDRQGVQKTWTLHKLVMLAFVGETPEGLEIRHLNDIKTDNRLSNLAFGTSSDNMFDRVRNGIHHNAVKSECKNGHGFTPDNTFINHGGSRECRTCRRVYMREYHRKARARKKAA